MLVPLAYLTGEPEIVEANNADRTKLLEDPAGPKFVNVLSHFRHAQYHKAIQSTKLA